MSYYGSWKIDDTLVFSVNTHNPTNGMATAADAVPTYHVYEDETSTPIITGSMSTLNSPSTIGFYSEQITLSAANGLDKGKSYNIYIRAVVGGVTGTVSHSFQIEAEVDSNAVSTTVGISTGTFLDALADKVWDELLSGHLTPGSAGHTLFSRMPTGTVLVGDKTGFYLGSPQVFDLIGNISGTITNVLNVINPVVAGVVTGSVLGNVNGSVNSVVNPVTAGVVTGSVLGNVNGSVNLVVQPVGISTGTFIEAIADQVWDETLSDHLSVGSTGEQLNAASATGDPWTTPLPGAYGAGSAGNIVGNFLDAPISGIPTNPLLDNDTRLNHLDADVSSVPTANQNADALLKRDWTAVTGEAGRSVLNALRFIRNKFSTTATPGSVTIYKEDDVTPAYTKPVTTDPAADPIVEG